jgi:hypothetical protein
VSVRISTEDIAANRRIEGTEQRGQSEAGVHVAHASSTSRQPLSKFSERHSKLGFLRSRWNIHTR